MKKIIFRIFFVFLTIGCLCWNCADPMISAWNNGDNTYYNNFDGNHDEINQTDDQPTVIFSYPEFDGQKSWGYPALTSVEMSQPITTASFLSGGGRLGFITFDISKINWHTATKAEIRVYKEKTSFDEELSSYLLSLWETNDTDYTHFIDCGCGKISMSPPTYGCLPDGCGFLIENPQSDIIPHTYLGSYTLEPIPNSGWLIIDSAEFLDELKNNFQGKTYLTLELKVSCANN